ncbi:sulfatase-like hydrolase/transferase [Longitalea arenae]|uniref:sulfatase-like hydrolase/transferase n=1 Tax=Longitalea arenae TaxID=2812558 RepID=UPI001967517E|nr:sulfatase-like hydrolase/transferase [Longitalea arenae]
MDLQKQKIWRWLCSALVILILPNLLFWVLELKFSLTRGLFVIEYLLIACLYPYINRRLFIAVWMLFAVYDMFFSTTSLFFLDFIEIAHALTKMPAMPLFDLLKWAALVVLFLAVIFGLLTLLMRYDKQYRVMHIRFLWPLILVCFTFNSEGPFKSWAAPFSSSKKSIASAPAWPFMKAVQHAIVKSTAKRNIEVLGSAAKKVFEIPTGEPAKKEALILVESWGLLTDNDLQQEVQQPLFDLARDSQYAIKTGSTAYKYLTQAGEFRELTGYVFHYYQVKDSWVKENSLLIKKQQQGYHVIGIHGNTGRFYRRQVLWPILGVQEMYFSENFAGMSMPMCGSEAFRGVCDTAINTWLLNMMNKQRERKEFYYWVTLNTHLPLVEIHDKEYQRFAEKWKQQGITENILQIAYQHYLLFKDLADKLSRPGSPKAHILLVGDHAPPFLDAADRKLFSDQLVPFIELIPNR